MSHTVFLLTDDDARHRALLVDAGLPGLTVVAAETAPEACRLAAGADLWLAEPARAVVLLSAARRLAWLQATYAGVEPLVAPGVRRDYCLTNVRGPFGPLVSEYVFGHLLSLTRHLPLYREQQRRRLWSPVPYRGLGGRTLLVVGTGSIGRHVAATGAHFDMRVWGVNRNGRPVAEFDRIAPAQALAAMLPEADVVVSALPSTPDTQHLFNETSLGRCRPGALFFNVGRGTAVDERALADVLRQGRLGAAVLDVFADEPLPETAALWDVPNLVVTPHDAARSFPEDVVNVFVRNYRHFVSGEPLEGRIDFERGY